MVTLLDPHENLSMVRSTRPSTRRTTYHHGNLREALLRHAANAVADRGPAALSLRAVARSAGVSHAAATHHFGDKAGLLTALAIDGLRDLAAALDDARPRGFLEVGVAYVRFAVEHPGAFAVMFDRDLVHGDDPDLLAARTAAGRALHGGAPSILAAGADPLGGAVAAWSLVHGLAGLIRGGMIPAGLPADPEELTRLVASHLGAASAPTGSRAAPSRSGRASRPRPPRPGPRSRS
jgi:AcrR family transcriptional regulator